MKRIATWILLLAMILPLLSCSQVPNDEKRESAPSETATEETLSLTEDEENPTDTEDPSSPPDQGTEMPTEPDDGPSEPDSGSGGSSSGESSGGSSSGGSSGGSSSGGSSGGSSSGGSSGGSSSGGSSSGGGTTPPVSTPASDAANPLTWAKINRIPIANASMSSDQLRQICVDFMKLQQTFSWIPSESFTPSTGREFTAGKVYGGIPYNSSSYSNLYRWMYFLDEKTGDLDVDAVLQYGQGKNLTKILGNQCSASAFWAWARVSNTFTWGGTSEMLSGFGCVPLGAWRLDASVTDFHKTSTDTREVCKSNDKNSVMFQAYSQIKKADGVVYYRKTAGHVMMAEAAAVVVRNPNGTINGDQSYVLFLEQQVGLKSATQSNGKPIQMQNGVSKKFTFNRLYSDGYLPFTMKEFIGLDPVEAAYANCNVYGNEISFFGLNRVVVTSNYPISDLTVTIKNSNGTVVAQKPYMFIAGKLYRTSLSVGGDLMPADWEDSYAGKGYTVELAARVGTGQLFTVCSGKLVS